MTQLSNLFKNFPGTSALTACLAAVLFNCVACAAIPDAEADPEPGKQKAQADTDAVADELTPQQQIAYARRDLASRLGIEPDAVQVSGVNSVTWRSGAVGCPRPGEVYTDVLVPGIWILLRVDKAIYRYHGIPGKQPFHCPEEWAEGPVVGPGAD